MRVGIRLAVRSVTRHPWRGVLSVAGIALGIAVVLAIDIVNQSARTAMRLSNEAVAAGSTHFIDGGPLGIKETLYTKLRVEHGMRNIRPVVSGTVSVRGDRFLLLGIDPFAGAFERGSRHFGSGVAPERLLEEANAAFLLDTTASRLGMRPPAMLPLEIGGMPYQLNVIGTIRADNELQQHGLSNVLITDISTAQTILGMGGRLSRIEVDTLVPEKVAVLLPPSFALIPNENRSQSMQQMTRAFHLNLTALSLLALVIGAFLIYNTMTLSVLQRREQFAVLRTLGMTPRQLFGHVMLEALLLGSIGFAVGGAAGLWLSHALLQFVSGTINDLYFAVEVQSVSVSFYSVAKALVLAIAGTVLAAWHPAWDAMRTSPAANALRSGVESEARRRAGRLLPAGLLLWGCAIVLLAGSGQSIIAGFAALFCIIIGFALITPVALLALVKLFDPAMRRCLGTPGYMAARGVRASLSRTQIAVASLAIAVAAVIGVSVMISSFRLTVEQWLHNFLRADVYIAQQQVHRSTGIDRQLIERVAALPEVRGVSTGRWATLNHDGGTTQLFAVDLDRSGFDNFQLKSGDANEIWPAFANTDTVIVSEPYAYHRSVDSGDSIALPTATAGVAFRVAGVFYDYGSDRGVVAMHRDTYDRHWDDLTISSFSLYLHNGIDVESFVERLNNGELSGGTLRVRSNRTIRQKSLQIFDRTFAITDILRTLAVTIAAIGVLTALMAIQLERAKDFAVLRAVGLSARQLWVLVTAECGLMGLAAGIIACPLGLAMAWVLVFVINRRSFGWTMQFHFDGGPWVAAISLSVIAAVIAGLYPAWRMSRTLPADALRYE